jgi:hypothetical protein
MIIKTVRKIATLTILAVSLSATSFAQDNTETIYFDEQSFPELDFSAGTEAFGQKLELAFGDISTATNEGPDPGFPVDGGLGFLLAAGLGYGARRLRKNQNNKKINKA